MFRLFLVALDLRPAIGDWDQNDFSHGQDKGVVPEGYWRGADAWVCHTGTSLEDGFNHG